MAKKKRTRGGIRIDGRLIRRDFATKADRDEWYSKMRQQKYRAKAGLEVEFEPAPIENISADFICSRMNNETWRHDKFRLEHYFFPRFQGRMIHSITRKEWKEVLEELITIHIMRIWSHSTRKIVQRTKGKRERIIGINETLLNALKRHLEWSPFQNPEELVVCNQKGRPFESKHLWEMHTKAMDAACLKYLTIHCLRHTFATQYLASGGHIWDLKNILGHKSIKTTERYAHVMPTHVQERANVFEIGVKI